MKKQTALFFLLSLTSCNQPNYAKETISKPKANTNTTSFSETEKAALKSSNTLPTDSDFLLSPLGKKLIDDYQSDKASFLSLYQKANRKENNFSLSSLFSVASTAEIKDKDTEGVSYFEGTKEELSNSLSRYYDREITLTQNGTYYLNEMEVTDRFLLPKELKKNLPFDHAGQFDYVEFVGDYEVVQNESYTYLALNINQTEMRLLLPKENGKLENLSLDAFYPESTETKRIHALVPKFEKSYSYEIRSEDRFLYQDNMFHFDEYGIQASSFTVDGPTSENPNYVLDLSFDHPFLYSCFYDDVMLFCGAVSSL